MCVERIFYFGFPVGWDELGVIATVLGAIATALAVIVALGANRKATEQLKSALEMQEKSKNVSLFDRRVELAENIRSGTAVSELAMRILFDEKICNHYYKWRGYLQEKANAEYDLKLYCASKIDPDSEDGAFEWSDILDEIEKCSIKMRKPNCPQEIVDEYEALCNRVGIWVQGDAKPITGNHLEGIERIAEAHGNAIVEQNTTFKLIEEFIARSIQ